MIRRSPGSASALQPPRGRRRRWRRSPVGALLALSLLLLATGCQRNDPDAESGTLHVLIATPSSEALTAESVETDLGQFKPLIDGFRELHPNVTLAFAIFQESHLMEELRRRNAAGLAPDLVLMSATRAMQLEQSGLIRPVTIPKDELRQLEMEGLTRVTVNDRHFAGVPVLQEPQLACYNRSRLPNPPRSVAELVTQAQNGISFGMAVDPAQLFWSAGSLGARKDVLASIEHEPLSPVERARITGWMAWLQTMNLQQVMSFLPDKDHLVEQLARQELDWIPCRSGNIALLKHHLGDRLGVAPLPVGPGGPPSPITRQMVWGFGVNSSPSQQQLAEQLVRFSINPLTQRTITLRTLEALPANRLALPPAGASPEVDAMLQSQQQGVLGHHFNRLIAEDPRRLEALHALMAAVVFGELTPEKATDRLIQIGGVLR